MYLIRNDEFEPLVVFLQALTNCPTVNQEEVNNFVYSKDFLIIKMQSLTSQKYKYK